MISPAGILVLSIMAICGFACIIWRLRQRNMHQKSLPNLSLLLLVRDQEDVIEGYMRQVLLACSSYPVVDLVVVDCQSTDATAEILERLCGSRCSANFVRWCDAAQQSPVDLGLQLCRGELVWCFQLEQLTFGRLNKALQSYLNGAYVAI